MGRLLSTTHELTPRDISGTYATTLQPNKVVVVHSNCQSSRQAARRMKEAAKRALRGAAVQPQNPAAESGIRIIGEGSSWDAVGPIPTE